MTNPPRFGFIGTGKLARGLASLLSQAYPGCSFRAWSRMIADNTDAQPWTLDPFPVNISCDVLFIAVPDEQLTAVVAVLAEQNIQAKIIIHCSGNTGVDTLAPLASNDRFLAAVHPAFSFTGRPITLSAFANSTICIECSPAARLHIHNLLAPLGARTLFAEAVDRSRYHAASVMASNLLIGLNVVAVELATSAGLAPDQAQLLVQSLMQNTLNNLAANEPADALTGPVKRGDLKTIESHLLGLAANPSQREVYRSLTAVITKLSHGDSELAGQIMKRLDL